MHEVIQAIRSIEGWRSAEWKTKAITERVSVSAQHVRDRLSTLEEYGYVNRRVASERGNPHYWSDGGLDDLLELEIGYEDESTFAHVAFTE
jgi:CTP-dependent riboflavin kinase